MTSPISKIQEINLDFANDFGTADFGFSFGTFSEEANQTATSCRARVRAKENLASESCSKRMYYSASFNASANLKLRLPSRRQTFFIYAAVAQFLLGPSPPPTNTILLQS